MPRTARVDVANVYSHVINRSNGRLQIFSAPAEYKQFEQILEETQELYPIEIVAYVLMPNHWHFLVAGKTDGAMGRFMHQLTNTHTRRVHAASGTVGQGHLYQGRYKSFLVDSDSYLLTLIKYIERNPVRAGLTKRAEAWQRGSAWRRMHGTEQQRALLSASPTPLPEPYLDWVNESENIELLKEVRISVNKGAPYGRQTWVDAMVREHKLESTLRSPGRPRKH